MKHVVVLVGIAMAAYGGLQLGSLGKPPFDYETATEEERAAFLTDEANDIASGVERGLISPSGVGPRFKLSKVAVNTDRRKIDLEITISNTGGGRPNATAFHDLSTKMKAEGCPRYVGTRLSANNVAVSYVFRTKEHGQLKKIQLTNGSCRRFVEAETPS